MKNKLSDLNDHLFMQLERLGDEDLVGDKLGEEILRARAVTDVAQQIIANANTVVKAQAIMASIGGGGKPESRGENQSTLLRMIDA